MSPLVRNYVAVVEESCYTSHKSASQPHPVVSGLLKPSLPSLSVCLPHYLDV